MTAADIKTIYEILANRVVPQSAREGAAIMALGARLVSHFANAEKPPQDSTSQMGTHPTFPPSPPDPAPPEPIDKS